ncbi:MAG: hypothetical protein NPIRA02_11980 [Nitrospirales bacterium]|nr:MAG: hypothetical protein NPIRA02_11980 [Nitrospirales bacterium]
MKTRFCIVASLFFLVTVCLTPVFATEDDGSTVKITSPEQGAVVRSSFELHYQVSKGSHGDHVHTYLDGKYQKGFQGMFHDVPPGKHQISVKVATHDHDVLAASDSIEVEVK